MKYYSMIALVAISSVMYAGGDMEPVVEPVLETEAVPLETEKQIQRDPVAVEHNEDANSNKFYALDEGYSVGLRSGSLGFGLDVAKKVTKEIDVRLNANYFSYSTGEVDIDDYTGEMNIDFASIGLIADYYIADTNYRVSAGAYYFDHGVDARTSGFDVTLDGTNYSSNDFDSASLDLSFENKVAAYVGVGSGSDRKAKKGFSTYSDVGVLVTGNPTVKGNVDCNPALGGCTQMQNDLDKESKNLMDSLEGFVHPVVSTGVSYTF